MIALLLLDGSLAYGTVWEKSDIDLLLLVRDGSIPKETDILAEEDGILVSVGLMEITKFKRAMNRWRGDANWSQFALAMVVFTKDESLSGMIESLRHTGGDDAVMGFLAKFGELYIQMLRAEKWARVVGNPLYAQRFLQWSCTVVAEMELMRRGEPPTREAILRALEPELMRELYVIPSTTAMTVEGVMRALGVIVEYLERHMPWWSAPILRFLADGEVKANAQILAQLHIGCSAFEFLADRGIVERATVPARLFKKSRAAVDELAYFLIPKEEEDHA